MKRILVLMALIVNSVCYGQIVSSTDSFQIKLLGPMTLSTDSFQIKLLDPMTQEETGTDRINIGMDTVKVLMLVSDTSIINGRPWHQWGYEVRYAYCCINGNTSGLAYYQPVPYYEHFTFLNNKKNRFAKSIVVWRALKQ